MAGSGNRGLVLALTGIALLLAAMLIAYRPPVPLGADASPGIVSAYRANAILRDLVGSGTPHPIGSLADVRMREAIVERLSAFGYATELQSGFVCNDGVCGRPVNIIARLRPAAEDQDAVLLAAHYDSVPAGPGASDDGAAVRASSKSHASWRRGRRRGTPSSCCSPTAKKRACSVRCYSCSGIPCRGR
jgi:class 3 adenylate cyclase